MPFVDVAQPLPSPQSSEHSRVVDKREIRDFINEKKRDLEARVAGLQSAGSLVPDQGQTQPPVALYLLYYTTCAFLSDDSGQGISLDLATTFLNLLDKTPSSYLCGRGGGGQLRGSYPPTNSNSLTRKFLPQFWFENFVQCPDLLQLLLLHQQANDPLTQKPSCTRHKAAPPSHG